jgi:hypothetical protein
MNPSDERLEGAVAARRLALRGAGHGEAGLVNVSGPEAGPGNPGGLRHPRNAFRRTSSTTLLVLLSPLDTCTALALIYAGRGRLLRYPEPGPGSLFRGT